MIASRAQEIYSAEFDRIFFKLPEQIRARLEAKISELGTKLNSFPHHRLKGSSDYRLRVGDYRVIYYFDLQKNLHYLVTVGNRREIYRNV
jgi:mRNA interferase RelE/StbE